MPLPDSAPVGGRTRGAATPVEYAADSPAAPGVPARGALVDALFPFPLPSHARGDQRVSRCSIASASAAPNPAAFAYRSAAVRASARVTTSSSARGTVALTFRGCGGGSVSRLCMTISPVGPANVTLPVSIS
jgi:hypothetical protein